MVTGHPARHTYSVPYGPQMRASDGDREKIAARLRDAHGEGRLSIEEFNDRLDALYQAQTYGEIEPLVRDIPVMRTHQTPEIVKAATPVPAGQKRQDGKAMRVLWTIWACAVSLNVMIWLLVSIGNGSPEYFWPIWVAGPWGAVLATITLIRRAAK